jgi:archaemetzincin
MNPGNIVLIPFGRFEKDLVERVTPDIEREFSRTVGTRDGYLDLSGFYDPARRQYNGTLLLTKIDASFATVFDKTVGLFNVDLFIPILTYIFGQAYLNGRAGIVSSFRLSNDRYGIRSDEKVLADRLRKEIIHELGHMFGLVHCHDPVCVMRSGNYVEDIDQKSHKLCTRCRDQLIISNEAAL